MTIINGYLMDILSQHEQYEVLDKTRLQPLVINGTPWGCTLCNLEDGNVPIRLYRKWRELEKTLRCDYFGYSGEFYLKERVRARILALRAKHLFRKEGCFIDRVWALDPIGTLWDVILTNSPSLLRGNGEERRILLTGVGVCYDERLWMRTFKSLPEGWKLRGDEVEHLI